MEAWPIHGDRFHLGEGLLGSLVVPAVALDVAHVFVAAAYFLFLTLVVIYVVIIGCRLARTESRLADLASRVSKDERG